MTIKKEARDDNKKRSPAMTIKIMYSGMTKEKRWSGMMREG